MKNMNKGYLWTCKYYFKYWEEKGETKGEMYGKGGQAWEGCAQEARSPRGYGGTVEAFIYMGVHAWEFTGEESWLPLFIP